MRLVASRASDYMRSASAEDRRYLLYSPLTKAKVTREGERVIAALWDVIAAKGVEKDTFFETVAREIGLLPRLEGTVHINIGLLAKFMPNFLFAPDAALPLIPRRDDAADDTFLFNQGPTGGLGKVRFHDWRAPFDSYGHLPNVALLREQIDVLTEMLAGATPDASQQKDILRVRCRPDLRAGALCAADLGGGAAVGRGRRAARRDLRPAGAGLQQLRRRTE